MNVKAETLKERIAHVVGRSHLSNKFRRLLTALEKRLTRPEYGPDGLLYACQEAMDDPAEEFDRIDQDRLWSGLIGVAYELFPDYGTAQDFVEAVRLWRNGPADRR